MLFAKVALALTALTGSTLAAPTATVPPAVTAAQEQAAFYAYRVAPEIVPSFDPSGALYVTYNSTTVQAGQQFSPSTVFFAPKVRFAPSIPSYGGQQKTYLLATLDYDAPSVTNHSLAYAVHWIQQDLKADANGALTSQSPAAAPYLSPGPPQNSGAHRYTFVLYEQPAGFVLPADVAKMATDVSARIHFDFLGFVRDTHLGDPVAGTFFRAEYDGIPIPPQPTAV